MSVTSSSSWSLARKVSVVLALVLTCCAVVAVLIYRDLQSLDFGNVVVYIEGVGPSYEETLAGETD